MVQQINVSERRIAFRRLSPEKLMENPMSLHEDYQEAMETAASPINKIYFHNLELALTSFKLYEMHTNFVISKQAYAAVTNTVGVEGIKIISPYRLLLAFGRLFPDREVAQAIRQNISAQFRETNESIKELSLKSDLG